MTAKRSFLLVALAITGLLTAALVQAKPVLDTEYKIIPLQPVSGKGIEVLEFFNYACPHCYEFEPHLKSWLKIKPKDAQFHYVPAVFNERMIPLAKLHYTLDEMGLLDKLHDKAYFAIHQQQQNLTDRAVMLKWAGEQGVDVKKFESIFDSFGIATKAQRAAQMTRNYRIQGTPYLVVNGRYLTGPSMTLKGDAVDQARFIEVLNDLIDMSRSGAK
jgi:protein dithiol oxidoreductase (disulfide-forming)